eukprot:3239220-Rhodomonas_salina.1
MRHRNRLLRKSTGQFGGFVTVGEGVLVPAVALSVLNLMRASHALGTSYTASDASVANEGERKQSRLLTPRLWFWHRIDMPVSLCPQTQPTKP